MSEKALKLDNHLCFSLYVCSKEIIKLYKPYLKKYNLTYTQYITLLVLWENDNINLSELGNKLMLDSGTLTPLLKKLEKSNYIKKIRDCNDERSIKLVLTKEGANLKNKFINLPEKMMCYTTLSPEEALDLKLKLDGIIESIQKNTN